MIAPALAVALACAPQDPGPAATPEPPTAGALQYRCVGPTRGGRVTTVAGVRQRRGEFYMGATGGGVWKTVDYGISWRNVSDGSFASPSIGAIRVAPSDPDVVWVGTGSDGLRSNVIQGRGVYRSSDAGETWVACGLEDAGQIGAVEVHPTDSGAAFVAAIGRAFEPSAARGLYRTRDGGRSWSRVLAVSDRTGVVDVEYSPADPSVVYCCTWTVERKPWSIESGGSEGGVYRSTDGGSTWTKLGGSLPDGLIGKIDLAVTAAAPARLYVLIEAPGDAGGVYRSEDGGDTFMQVSDDRGLRARPFYYTNIDADPVDPDRVYVNAMGLHRSEDGGVSWTRRSTPHGDNHDLWIHPDDPRLMIQANDGGANVTLDGGDSWSTQRNQPTAELYQVAVDDRFPYWLYAGQQDNSTIRVPVLPPWPSPSGATGYWQSVGGCETGPAVPKPGDPDVVYAACKGRFQVFHFRTGQTLSYDVTAANMYGHDPKDLRDRFQRVSPVHVSPHDPGVVYHASQFVYRTRDEGRTWERISPDLTAFEPGRQGISGGPITRDITGEEFYSCLYALAESPLQEGLLWVGSNDGPIHVSRDGGGSWDDVTPSGLPPGGRVQCIEPSPHRPGTAYVTWLRYMLGDERPWLWRTDDGGGSWVLLTNGENGIPADVPVRAVREDPVRAGLLYCGTERGVFVSFDDGASWTSLQRNLPVVPVTDLRVHRDDLVLSTMGRSFWILDDLAPLRQWGAKIDGDGFALARPDPAHRMYYRSSSAVPEYPAPGAWIDYWLPEAHDGELTLEIRDASARVVRVLSSEDPGERWSASDQERMPGSDLLRVSAPRLSTDAGHNRVRWDLRHPGPWHEQRRRAGRRGPMVAPAIYELRLRGGGREAVSELEVRLDPRVVAEGVTLDDVREQEVVGLRIRDEISRARRLAAGLERSLESASTADSVRLTGLRARLVTAEGPYPQPMLIDQLGYLAGIVDGADQRPGRDVGLRLAEWTAALDEIERAMD